MNWPTPLDGDTPLHRWLNRFLMATKASQPLTTADVKVGRGPEGSQLKVNFPPVPRFSEFHPFQIRKVANFQYCVRGGFVAVRPRNGMGDVYNMNFNRAISEYRLLVKKGSDQTGVGYTGIPGYEASDFYKAGALPKAGASGVETVTVGNTGDFGAANDTNAVIFKLNEAQDSSISDPAASFFINLTDDGILPDGVHGQIKCRMVTTEGVSTLSRTNTMFPDDCIPIGLVIPSGGNWGISIAATPAPLEIEQLLYDHYLYRVPHFNNGNPFNNWTAQMPLHFLGVWSDATDADFSDKTYYPGDVVVVDDTAEIVTSESVGETVSIDFRNAYVKLSPVESVASRPAVGAGGWELLAGIR